MLNEPCKLAQNSVAIVRGPNAKDLWHSSLRRELAVKQKPLGHVLAANYEYFPTCHKVAHSDGPCRQSGTHVVLAFFSFVVECHLVTDCEQLILAVSSWLLFQSACLYR